MLSCQPEFSVTFGFAFILAILPRPARSPVGTTAVTRSTPNDGRGVDPPFLPAFLLRRGRFSASYAAPSHKLEQTGYAVPRHMPG